MVAFDALVAGAGPAGAIAAHQLARAGRSVLLVDPRIDRAGPEKPGDALTGAALRVLAACGLPPPSANPAHRPIGGNISLWGGREPVWRDFVTEPDGPAWRLDRAAFEADLIAAARAAGATTSSLSLRHMVREDEVWRLDLGDTIASARWLIDATGRRAALARRLGARRIRDEPLVALVGHARPDMRYRMEHSLIEATADGWWYASLLPDRRLMFMLHARPAHAGGGLARLQAWQDALAATDLIASTFPDPVIEGPLRGYEACGAWLETVRGDGWVACGDAALSFDPCAGQGLLSALYGGMTAANAVAAAMDGDARPLAAYAAQLANVRRTYRARVRAHYANETRWRSTEFWRTSAEPQAA